MTKWILAAGLVVFATAAQAQYYGGSSYGYSSNGYNGGYVTSNTYGGNNDPSPSYHSVPSYQPTYRTYQPRYSSGYVRSYRSYGY